MDSVGSPPADSGRAPEGPFAGVAPGDSDGVEVDVDRSEDDDGSDVPWAGIGVLMVVLVTGAFAAGWHFGRRWGRLMGW